ncbi:MAG TPA: hypothetical protein EYN96_06440 [Candidatus Hydrogenedentes bacterium]|nr:hypothetical protein [Candidatus Hydrogenedentota bacterium]
MWQTIYEDLKDQNFELISAAQDTGGEAKAGPIFDRANVTYTAIVDVNHTISSLFNLVNVPSGVWINEEGRIVRIDEGTYTKSAKVLGNTIGHDGYVPALRDWIAKGDESAYIMSPDEVASNIRLRVADEELAEPNFKLANYFYAKGNMDSANAYWDKAQALSPDSWNFHRQDWSFLPSAETNKNFLGKVNALTTSYYAPMSKLPEGSK